MPRRHVISSALIAGGEPLGGNFFAFPRGSRNLQCHFPGLLTIRKLRRKLRAKQQQTGSNRFARRCRDLAGKE